MPVQFLNTLKINFDTQDPELFKSWLLEKWKNKDDFLNNYNKYIYKKLEFDDPKYRHIAVIALVCLIFSLLTYLIIEAPFANILNDFIRSKRSKDVIPTDTTHYQSQSAKAYLRAKK